LIQEEVSEAQNEYNLVLAGFMPTKMIKINNNKTSVKIDELLYAGGLGSYLSNWQYSQNNYLKVDNSSDEKEDEQRRNYHYNQAWQLNSYSGDGFLERGIERCRKGDMQGAIKDYTQAIRMNPTDGDAYFKRGVIRFGIGNKMSAGEDFQKAAELYLQQGNQSGYQTTKEIIDTLISTDKIPF